MQGMQKMENRLVSLVAMFCVGCISFDAVQADPPKYHVRTEIDFEKLEVHGTMAGPDPVPKHYDGVPRYYDTTGLITSAITTKDAELARTLVKAKLEKTSGVLQHWGTNEQYSIESLDWAQVYALYHLMFDKKQSFEERDIRLHSPTEKRIVSVRQEPNGLWKLSKSRKWTPRYRETSIEQLQDLYLFSVFQNRNANWTDEQLAIVADALRVLEPQEVKYLRGLKWTRARGNPRTELAGRFRFENVGHRTNQSITLYDKTFEGLPYTFCGTIEKPHSAAHVVIVHELGHLLADQPRIAYGNEYNKTVDKFNKMVSRFNRTQDQGLLSKIERLQAKIAHMEANPVTREGPIIEAFLANRSGKKGPTRYADFNTVEAFAESYALYKLDPTALRRIDPPLYQWFESKAYIDLLP